MVASVVLATLCAVAFAPVANGAPRKMTAWKVKKAKPQARTAVALVNRVPAVLGVARSAWPRSACRGREVVVWSDRELRATFPALNVVAMAPAGGPCRVVLGDPAAQLSLVGLCDVLTHELGHLAGVDHSAPGQYPAGSLGSVMTAELGHWSGCALVRVFVPGAVR